MKNTSTVIVREVIGTVKTSGTVTVVAPVPLPTGSATLAEQQTQTTRLNLLATQTTLAAVNTNVDGFDNAGAGGYVRQDSTSSMAKETGGNLAAVLAALVLIKDTDGVKKIFDALPAGTNLLGKVGIDQTTPGTTNKVSIGTDGTVAVTTVKPDGTNTAPSGDTAARAVFTQSKTNGRPTSFEDTAFVTGDSPATLDVNAALGRNGSHGYIANDGGGTLTVAISDDNGANYSSEITVYSGDLLSLEAMDVDRIRVTWVSNCAYRITVW